MNPIAWAERGRVPDPLIRAGIRQLCRRRLSDEAAGDPEDWIPRYKSVLADLRKSPIAVETEAANRQHYEVPPEFFRLVLGPHLKYSACWFEKPSHSLEQAEAAMLALTCERAELEDGQRILEMGCGWGSLTLWMAERYPNARITAVSNSALQRRYIDECAARRGLQNVSVVTADMNEFDTEQRYDRAVSVEMFEHMRNYRSLMHRIATWLEPHGKLFVHIFCHRLVHYPFETEGDGNWLGRHFFTGGLMPARDTLLHFQEDLAIDDWWWVSGTHYERTANAWLDNLDEHRDAVLSLFRQVYGDSEAAVWRQRWRIFFMACAELFGYDGGREWLVGHYRFKRGAGHPCPTP